MENTNQPTTHRTRTALLALPVAVVLLAAGFFGGYAWGNSNGTDSSTSPIGGLAARASATGHNDADVTFVQMMVPHHSQALDMAKLASTRASSSDVKTLASQIEAAQQPEIDKMNGWLTAWGADTGMDHGSMKTGDGMMSQSGMGQLKNESGAAFDKDFLSMMIQHHNGAISMAETELEGGSNADALALATSIQLTQQAQVTQMQNLLNQ